MYRKIFFAPSIALIIFSCAADQPFLSGFIKKAYDAVLANCDPYGQGKVNTCIVFSSANQGHLYVYNASRKEMVLGPSRYRPLMIKVGKTVKKLVTVEQAGKNFPWIFALDFSEPAIYPVRMFPSADKKDPGLKNQLPQALLKKPASMAAALFDNRIIAVLTVPAEQSIQVLAINQDTGIIDQALGLDRFIKQGVRPAQVSIIADRVIITDEGANDVITVKLADLSAFLTNNTPPNFQLIPLGMPTDKLYVAQQKLADKITTLALVGEARGKKVSLVDIEAQKVVGSFSPDSYPMAFYLPDQDLVSFDQAKNWLSLVNIKGSLEHYSMAEKSEGLEFKKLGSIDLLSDTNLDLSTVQVAKIIGGTIEPDGKKQEKTCLNNRQVYYIATGNSKSYIDSETYEVEAHSHACENDHSAARLGSEQSIGKYEPNAVSPTFGQGI